MIDECVINVDVAKRKGRIFAAGGKNSSFSPFQAETILNSSSKYRIMIITGGKMIKTTHSLLKELETYRTPSMKIKRMVDAGELYAVKRGLYETDRSCPPAYLSGVIYGPSYLSFEYALSVYGLIPERVNVYTAATLRKNRSKRFSNTFGNYSYRDIPESAFPYGITLSTEREYTWLIATPEKALCDLLYVKQGIVNTSDLEGLLFDSLRIEVDDFDELDRDQLLFLSERYRSSNLRFLKRYMEEKK